MARYAMSEALPDDVQGLPEPDARPPVAPPVQGTAPAFPDPSEQPLPIKSEIESEETAHVFSLEEEGHTGMTGTAERIGAVMGSAQRQMRRGLELVRRPAGSQIAAITMDAEE